MPRGWQTLGDEATAEEEVEHARLWEQFAAALQTRVAGPQMPEVKKLVEVARRLFADPVEAIGALYAFEVQQPATSESKLAGLRRFYQLPASGETYFEEHQHNQHEAEKLLSKFMELAGEQKTRALDACEEMSKALWDALTGIYNTNVVM
jgi:pyrroloquinoline-quinone synthase